MFKLARIFMWIEEGWSGKREYAFLLLVFAAFISILFLLSNADANLKANIVFYWVVAAILTGLAAFGYEAFINKYIEILKLKDQAKNNPEADPGQLNDADYTYEEPKQ